MSDDRVFKALIINTDGHRILVEWAPAQDGSETGMLGLLQGAVGGYVEIVQLSPTLTMWVNEEGAFRMPENHYARWFGSFYDWGTMFFGDVVLTGGSDEAGNTLSLTDDQVKDILEWPWPKPIETVNLPGLAGENDTTKKETT